MKRDMNLIRCILLYIEKKYNGTDTLVIKSIDDTDKNEFCYHFKILVDAGFINGKSYYSDNEFQYALCSGLTWEGQEYLSSIKSDKVWKKVLKKSKDTGVELTIDLAKALAITYAKDFLGI